MRSRATAAAAKGSATPEWVPPWAAGSMAVAARVWAPASRLSSLRASLPGSRRAWVAESQPVWPRAVASRVPAWCRRRGAQRRRRSLRNGLRGRLRRGLRRGGGLLGRRGRRRGRHDERRRRWPPGHLRRGSRAACGTPDREKKESADDRAEHGADKQQPQLHGRAHRCRSPGWAIASPHPTAFPSARDGTCAALRQLLRRSDRVAQATDPRRYAGCLAATPSID